ncbi:MAG: hypothetical protein IAF08_13660 [Rhizobacter sp.]|nr:hypothetical protein [Chlorobiales bacterium]
MNNPVETKLTSPNAVRGGESRTGNESVGTLVEKTVKETYDDTLEILSAKIAIAKLDISEMIADVAVAVVLAMILLIGMFYLFTAAAIFLGELFGRMSLGYLTMGSVVLAGALFFWKVKPEFLRDLFRRVIEIK